MKWNLVSGMVVVERLIKKSKKKTGRYIKASMSDAIIQEFIEELLH